MREVHTGPPLRVASAHLAVGHKAACHAATQGSAVFVGRQQARGPEMQVHYLRGRTLGAILYTVSTTSLPPSDRSRLYEGADARSADMMAPWNSVFEMGIQSGLT